MFKLWLILAAVTIAISGVVDWITLLISKKNLNFLSSVLLALCIVYLWFIIATGGIVAWLN